MGYVYNIYNGMYISKYISQKVAICSLLAVCPCLTVLWLSIMNYEKKQKNRNKTKKCI